MSARVLLVRGVNVGGHGRLPMADLRAHLLACGARTARTYLQSGNAVVSGPLDTAALGDRIAAAHGFHPVLLTRSAAAWRGVLAGCPVDPGKVPPRRLHAWVFDGAPATTETALAAAADPTEHVALRDGVLYLHAPDEIGPSRFASRVERLLGTPATARNWNTITALARMLAEIDAPP